MAIQVGNFIKINKNYTIGSDSRQWIIKKRRKPTPKDPREWANRFYYSSLKAVGVALRDLLVREGSCTSIDELIALVDDSTELVSSKLNPTIKVN